MVPISVIMPVYNTPKDILNEAVKSILNQSFADFEFIIIDDCSDKAECKDYLESLYDERIRIIRNPQNLGITKSLNIGLRAASGKYIARMDSDDISLPRRLEKQYSFMEEHTDTLICGTSVSCFGDRNWTWRVDTSDQEMYRIRLLFHNIGPSHPSVMFRKDKMRECGLWYDERLRFVQDYMMWAKASRFGTIRCMDEILVRQRIHGGQVTSAKAEEQSRCGILVRREQLAFLLDNVGLEEAELHKEYTFSKTITEDASRWFRGLIAANRKKQVYDREKFEKFVIDMIKERLYETYEIHWKDPRSYRILFKHLPATYVFEEARKALTRSLKSRDT